MRGLMMNTPLLITAIMRHGETHHPNREIVSVTADDPRYRYNLRRRIQAGSAVGQRAGSPGNRATAIALLRWPGTTTGISRRTMPSRVLAPCFIRSIPGCFRSRSLTF